MTQLTLSFLKYVKGIFNLNAVWHSDFLMLWQLFHRKRAKSLENFFSRSGIAILSILLKYQEIDVRIQNFIEKLKHPTYLLFE